MRGRSFILEVGVGFVVGLFGKVCCECCCEGCCEGCGEIRGSRFRGKCGDVS